MKQGNITIPNGEPIIFGIPESLSELSLSAYIDFLVWREKDGLNEIEKMARCVNAFYGLDLSVINEIGIGSREDADKFVMDTTYALYAHALRVIAQADISADENCAFEHNGQTFILPSLSRISVMGEDQFLLPTMTTGEMIEVAEIRRRFQMKAKEQAPEDADGLFAGDKDGALLFSQYVYAFAVLVRKPGERLPLSDTERDMFIAERVGFFQNINAQAALKVDFFLTGFLQNYESSLQIPGFLSHQTFGLVLTTRLMKPVQKARSSSKMKKPLNVLDGVKF